MISEPPSRTQVLAGFLAEISPEQLPDRLYQLSRRYVLDTLGVMIFGIDQPWSKIAAAQGKRVLANGEGACTVIGYPWKASPPVAAFINGSAGHAFELDDVHDETIMHPGTVVIPAALAVAEDQNNSGEEFLTAVIMGYEAAARAGLAVNPNVHMLRGFHPTGTMGVFGAAAATGVLLKLSSQQMNHALGIAASMASGIMEFSQSGGMVKRIHGGRAAEGGVQAAYLAKDGFEGPTQGLDGKFGYCCTFSDEPQLHLLTEDLGSRFMIDEITVKPYACCSDVHPIIDALLEIKQQPKFDLQQIERIDIEAPTKVAEQNSLNGLTSIMAAQYSAKFTAAATLLRDIRDPSIYSEDSLEDPEIRLLHDKVFIKRADEFDIEYAWKIGARVKLTLADGKLFESTVNGALGSIHNPLTQTQVEQKFKALVSKKIDAEQTEHMIHDVNVLKSDPSLEPMSRLRDLL